MAMFDNPPKHIPVTLDTMDKLRVMFFDLELENKILKRQLAEATGAYALLSGKIITKHEQVQADIARMIKESKEGEE